MIAGVYNLTIEQGSTFGRIFSLQQPDIDNDPTGQTYINIQLTNFTARMQIRRTIDTAGSMIVLTTENGRMTINPNIINDPTADNEVLISITAADTALLNTDGVYDLEIISPSGLVYKMVRGNVKLIHEVTR